ncbi:DNA topoisomerase 3 [Cohnella hashimotonis]|uniref:DNA topoisomerase n=1 Tax=Cohnella hashimotonis TaxID=2826895 RepID=A0ABT6TDC7_9BACL|nr:DNA topoisomerase 3 [Cohnella hashimotonis]MDI4644774.1 DNA topoisomerase 3 [Cohnella hashimotonis]
MKTLVIAEKPDMGRNIAAVIEPKAQNRRSYLEGEQYIITWAIGHLIGLAEPDLYDDKYKKWRLGDLPIIPERFKLLPNPRTKDQLETIREVAKRCDRLVNACDAGREGQHIFSLIQRHLGLSQPVKRLWISDLTAETIRKGFAELKEGAEYENLTRAARARSEADWLIGMNGSRAFTTRHNELLSVGRVQTPVLALIYDRQVQIESFDSLKFYEVSAQFVQGDTEYRGLWQGERISDGDKAKSIADKVRGKEGKIASYEVKDTKEYPWRLYDLTLLQREANGKLGFSAKKTLDVAQALYEKHKVITYPRTNSNYVNNENIPEMHKALDALRGTDYEAIAAGGNKRLVHTGNKGVCNPAKVEDHHAIMPTAKKVGALSPDERKLYDMIVRRFVSHFYPPAEFKMHTVLTEVAGETFKTTVKQLIAKGWKVVYEDAGSGGASSGGGAKKGKADAPSTGKDDDAESERGEEVETSGEFSLLAELPVQCAEAEAKEKETQPPKPYTEGTLLKAMESAGKQIEDEELRDAMKDSGLGTPATRAATIERLKQVGYVDMQGKRIVITPKGRSAIQLIRGAGVELLASPEMTGQWERRLAEISRGQASADVFMANVQKFTRLIVDKVRVQPPATKAAFARPEPAAGRGRGKGKTAGDGGAAGGSRGRGRSNEAGDAEAAGGAGGRGRGKAQADGSASAGDAPSRSRAKGTGAKSAEGRSSGTAAGRSPGATGAATAAGARSRGAAAGSRAATALATSAAPAAAGPSAPPASAGSRAPSAPAGSTSLPASAGASASPAARPAVIAKCPRPGCGGSIFMGRKGYGCSEYKSGCGFVVWRDSFGLTLDERLAAELIRTGRTSKLSLRDEAGSMREARIVLADPSTGRLAIED